VGLLSYSGAVAPAAWFGYRAFDPDVNPSREHRRMAFAPFFEDVLTDMIDSNFDLDKKFVENPRFGDLFKGFVFDKVERSLRPERR
jgi:hypothetical protein